MQTPRAIDWSLFELELNNMEHLVDDFYNQLGQGLPAEQVRKLADNLRQQFQNFKSIAKNAAKNPEGEMVKLQSQLNQLTGERDRLTAEVGKLELDLSKSSIQLEFLEKERKNLEQAKLHLDLELKKSESNSYDDFLKSLIEEETRVNGEIEALAGQISGLENLFKDQQQLESQKQRELHNLEGEFRRKQDDVNKFKDQEAVVNIEKAKVDTQMQVLTDDILRNLGEELFSNIKQQAVIAETQDLEAKIGKLKNQLEMIGGMDELTLKEYQETETRYTTLSTQVEDLKHGMEDLRHVMDELDEHIKTKFQEAFYKINEKFEHYFRVLFNGGRAYLSLLKDEPQAEKTEEEQDAEEDATPQSELRPEEKVVQKYEHGASNVLGVDIKATPPDKKLASIQALSGGERALTSIALLCSLLTCFPSPFVVLDEVDAALDDANTIRFGQILGTLAHQTQFITITHNRETMAQANILYGVTMGDDGMSKLLSVKLEQAKAFAK